MNHGPSFGMFYCRCGAEFETPEYRVINRATRWDDEFGREYCPECGSEDYFDMPVIRRDGTGFRAHRGSQFSPVLTLVQACQYFPNEPYMMEEE